LGKALYIVLMLAVGLVAFNVYMWGVGTLKDALGLQIGWAVALFALLNVLFWCLVSLVLSLFRPRLKQHG
jgi:hypothetical protein